MAEQKKKQDVIGYLMLRPNAGVPSFQRTLRDTKDKIVDKLVFPEGKPVAIKTQRWAKHLAKDIGNALVVVNLDEFGRPKVDYEATEEVVASRENRKPAKASQESPNHESNEGGSGDQNAGSEASNSEGGSGNQTPQAT